MLFFLISIRFSEHGNFRFQNSKSTQTMPKVLIVGGGIAGINAALTLQHHSIPYTLLEAQSRLGGRLKTVQGLNGKYDLGASWFHETLNNPLFDEENGIDDGVSKFIYDDSPARVICETGEVSGMLKLESIVQEMEKYVEMKCNEDLESDCSYYDMLIHYLKRKKHLLSEEQIGMALEYARGIELWHGIDIKRLSAKYAPLENEGRDALALHYDRVLKRHTDQLDMKNVLLNCSIVSVEKLHNGKSVKVTTDDGVVHEADFLIIAVPQSILQLKAGQQGHINFNPSLPPSITEPLEKVHYGALGKVVFEFDHVFWPAEHERVFVLSTAPKGFTESIINDTQVLDPKSSKPSTWEYPVVVLNYAASLKVPTLVILTQSPLTEYLESSPLEAWNYFSPIITKLSHTDYPPLPTKTIVTDWSINPYQRGSYAACFPGDDPISAVMALENGWGNVRFAGEHTIMEGNGCVHGAWASGKREADYVVRKLNR